MKCEEVLPLMHRHMDVDLDSDEQEILSRHLSTCPACREQFEQLGALSRRLESLPHVDPPRSIVEHMQDRFQWEERNLEIASSNRRRKRRYWLSGLATTAVLFLIVWIAQFSGLGLTSSDMREAQDEPMSTADMPAAEKANDNGSDAAPATEAGERASGIEEDGAGEQEIEPEMAPFANSEQAEEKAEMDMSAETQETEEEIEPDSPVGPLGEKEEYMSPDGTYTGYLGYGEEDIRIDHEGEAYYLWVHPRDKSWQVEWMEWVAEDELYFELVHSEGEDREYWSIDASKRDARQLEEPHPQSIQDIDDHE